MDGAKTLELFRSTMPPLRLMRRELAPSAEWHVRVELLGGSRVLSGQLDLVLGAQAAGRRGADRLAIDLKTEARLARARRGHALLRAAARAAVRRPALPCRDAVPRLGVAGRGRRRGCSAGRPTE